MKITLLILATGLFSAAACPTPNVGTVPCHALVPRDVILFAWVACVLPHGTGGLEMTFFNYQKYSESVF